MSLVPGRTERLLKVAAVAAGDGRQGTCTEAACTLTRSADTAKP